MKDLQDELDHIHGLICQHDGTNTTAGLVEILLRYREGLVHSNWCGSDREALYAAVNGEIQLEILLGLGYRAGLARRQR